MASDRRILLSGILIAGGGIGVLSGLSGVFTKEVCAALGVSRGGFSAASSLATLVCAFVSPAAAARIEKESPRRSVLTGALVCTLCCAANSFFTRLWQFYLASCVSGLFLGRITMLAVGLLFSRMEPGKRENRLGFAFSSSGLFTAAATIPLQKVIARFGWRWGYRACAVSAFLLLLAAALLLPRPQAMPSPKAGRTAEKKPALPTGIGAAVFFVNLCNLAMLNHALPFLTDLGYGARAAHLVSAAMALLFVSRIAAGFLYGKYGARTGTRLLALGVCMAAFCALRLPEEQALRLYAPLLSVCGTASALPAAALAGTPDGGQDTTAYARLTRAASLGSACGGPLAGMVFDRCGSYRPMWWLCAGLGALSWYLFGREKKRR